MALIHIKCGPLSSDQKKRIGGRVIDAFHEEGIPASSVIVLFGQEETDLLLEGGLLFEARAREAAPAPVPARPTPPPAPSAAPEPDESFKNKLRRNKGELHALKEQLIGFLQTEGALSSFQAQEMMGLKTCDWAPATLRRFFSELEDEGVIQKQGQKRGTRYVWKGLSGLHAAAPARLIKRNEEDPAEVGG
ncbi:hypothetical protein [Mesoterricola sediminis]|uniref:Uncharacterized protein n=1 Tax=Mesoterricola sediminis TaxID=2927980 RepID=A0AA48GTU4_9BACT|nr:hypothetical protein [Mesoterricola sediminis]BDU77634.1 hypothetical protein METESE_25920 [Mesoterricola sediminis]